MAEKNNKKKTTENQKSFFQNEVILGMSGRCVHACLQLLQAIFLNF